jgi:glycogen phosphorylase
MNWKAQISQHWPEVRLGSLTVFADRNQHVFSFQVHLNELAPDAVQVELYADPLNGSDPN